MQICTALVMQNNSVHVVTCLELLVACTRVCGCLFYKCSACLLMNIT
jgi:hypothetical protein